MPVACAAFQSQTGSQALSDEATQRAILGNANVSIPHEKPGALRKLMNRHNPQRLRCFNPKREARPSQTLTSITYSLAPVLFQSQTGSQALSDEARELGELCREEVSIPNGKPGPLRPGIIQACLTRLRPFQSQTGSQALSDEGRRCAHVHATAFQSQTGSQALSDPPVCG